MITNTLDDLKTKRNGIEKKIENLQRSLGMIDGTIAMFQEAEENQSNGNLVIHQESPHQESITDFVRGIFNIYPSKWFYARDIVMLVRHGEQKGLVDVGSDALAATHNVLGRLANTGELMTKGERQKRRYKLKS